MVQTRKSQLIIFILLLAAASAIVYRSALRFDFVNWDDDLYIYNNPLIREFSPVNLEAVFTRTIATLYVPLPLLSYTADYFFWGLDPAGYHLTNIVLHAANGLLVFFLLRRFYGPGYAPFLASLLFVVHPVQVETVAWISQRKTLLCFFFTVVSFLCYLKFLENGRKRWVFFCAAAFFASLLCKPVSLLLPVLFFCHACGCGRLSRSGVLLFVLLLVPAVLIGAWSLFQYPGLFKAAFAPGLAAAAGNAGLIFAFYVFHSFYPWPLDLFYALPSFTALPVPVKILSIAVLPAALLASLYLLRRRKAAGFWLAWVIVFLLPVANFFPVPVSDRHLYFPLVGLLALAVPVPDRFRIPVSVLLTLLAVLFVPSAAVRLQVWRNGETLWKSVNAREQSTWIRAEMQLAGYYEDRKRIREAEETYKKVIDARPDAPYAYINLYNIYALRGDRERMELLDGQFAREYSPSLKLSAVYEDLLKSKSNPGRIREIIRQVNASRYAS